jgi:hypothetical protein
MQAATLRCHFAPSRKQPLISPVLCIGNRVSAGKAHKQSHRCHGRDAVNPGCPRACSQPTALAALQLARGAWCLSVIETGRGLLRDSAWPDCSTTACTRAARDREPLDLKNAWSGMVLQRAQTRRELLSNINSAPLAASIKASWLEQIPLPEIDSRFLRCIDECFARNADANCPFHHI